MMTTSLVGDSDWRDDWGTPRDRFDAWHARRSYTIDVFAQEHNSLLPRYCIDAHIANLSGQRGFANPPYSDLDRCVRTCYVACMSGGMTFCDLLLPSNTDTRWWHHYVWNEALSRFRDGVTANFLKGRLRFQGAKFGAPFASVLVTFDKGPLL